MLDRFHSGLRLVFAFALAIPLYTASLHAQDATRRGRKYKAPPDTSHIEVTVLKDSNGKPLLNAAVIFHPTKDGVDEGNLEVKTNEQGKAIIDVIPTGSDVGVQVIADGFATYAGDYVVKEATRAIEVRMIKPRAQVSTYVDSGNKESQRPIGVQEPATPATLPGSGQPLPPKTTPEPAQTSPSAKPATVPPPL